MMDAETLVPSSNKILPWLLAIAIFMQMLDTTILNTALPAIARDLNESPLQMQSVIISYALTLALCSPLSGVMSDRFGTNRIFLLAITLFSLGSLFCALAPTLNYLVMARIIQGMGGALLTPVARLAIIKTYPKSQLLDILNYAVMPALLGPVLGPVLGGYIVEWMSWHWIFLMNLPIGVICIVLGFRYMPNFTDQSTKLDIRGFLLFSGAIFLITLGLEYLSRDRENIIALSIIFMGLILLLFYVKHARHYIQPIFPLILFKIRTYRIGVYGNLLSRLGISAVPFLLPLFFQIGLGYSPSVAGWMLVPIAFAGILMKPFITPIIHKFGYRSVLMVNTVLISILIMSLGFLGPMLPKVIFCMILFFLGLCNSMQFSAMNTLTLANLRIHLTSSGNGLMVVNQQLALSFSVAFAAIFLNLFNHYPLGIFVSETEAFQSTLIVVGLFTFFATLIFRSLKEKDGNNLVNR